MSKQCPISDFKLRPISAALVAILAAQPSYGACDSTTDNVLPEVQVRGESERDGFNAGVTGTGAKTPTQIQIVLNDPLPTDPAALGRKLQTELELDRSPDRVRVEPGSAVAWGAGDIHQPERWRLTYATPGATVTAEYWVGNHTVSVRRFDPNVFAWLNRLHKGTGANVGWVLLVDTLAGGLIVLALSGLLLWTRLHGPRLLAIGLIGGCLALALTFAFSTG